MSPPSEEYASIINVSDYDLSGDAQFSEISHSEKQRRQTGKKTVRRAEEWN